MSIKVILEYNYKPENYFEQNIKIQRDKYVLTILSGKVSATTEASIYDPDNELENTVYNDLNAFFKGAQVFSHRPYELKKGGIVRLHPNGRRDVTIVMQPAVLQFKGRVVDIKVTDRDGNVIEDTKAERVKESLEFANLAAKVAPLDPVAMALLQSYTASVNDPANELAHLYEIRDSLCTHFQSENEVRKVLNVSKTRWQRFGHLANEAPVTQGRHRGKKLGQLRSATKEELDEARSFATDLVHAYLLYSQKLGGEK